jgi:putative sugar O-methyltransferase
MSRIEEMIAAMEGARPEVLPSRFWQQLNQKNLDQLGRQGYENFKQTLATNYFTWLPTLPYDRQFRFFLRAVRPTALAGAVWRAVWTPRQTYFSAWQSVSYNVLTSLLWEYVMAQPAISQSAAKLEEPEEGNPPHMFRAGKLISQDLANSILEYQAITEQAEQSPIESIMELGAGYGRTAYVFMKLQPHVRYIIVDIPPALYVAERYLSSQFSDRKIFSFRPFERFSEIRDEFNNANLIFLLPNQLDLLPDGLVSHFINISSLHEMRIEQIRYYFEQINRLVRQHFYIKQWKVSHLPADNTVIREADYPIPEGWRQLYWRECAVQTYFFEALFERTP